MGMWDTVLILGIGGVAVWYVVTHKDELFPPPTEPVDGQEPTGDGDGETNGGGGGGGDGGGGSADCKKACSNCWCKTYSEQCGGSCSKCCGGSRIASKCGGQGVKSCSGGGGGGGGSLEAGFSGGSSGGSFSGGISGGSGGKTSGGTETSCRDYCSKGWCESYRAKCRPCNCSKCCGAINIGGSSPSCPAKVSGNCGGDCKKTCWHGRSGSNVYDTCVSKAFSTGACADARAKFCRDHGPCSSLAKIRTYKASYFSDPVGLGPGRVENYEDLFYPHNTRAMRISIA